MIRSSAHRRVIPILAVLLAALGAGACTERTGGALPERTDSAAEPGAPGDRRGSTLEQGLAWVDSRPLRLATDACAGADAASVRRWVALAYVSAARLIPDAFDGEVRVTCDGVRVRVDFRIADADRPRPPATQPGEQPPPYPGPDYHARVTIDPRTDRVLEVLGG